jgi:hypothetical protein
MTGHFRAHGHDLSTEHSLLVVSRFLIFYLGSQVSEDCVYYEQFADALVYFVYIVRLSLHLYGPRL